MPQGFIECRAKGGKIRTINGPNKQMGVGPGEYLPVCIQGTTVHRGYVKKKEKRYGSKQK